MHLKFNIHSVWTLLLAVTENHYKIDITQISYLKRNEETFKSIQRIPCRHAIILLDKNRKVRECIDRKDIFILNFEIYMA